MEKISCELCSKTEAKIHCDSDEAKLCWDCDKRVHSANFLVAKHSRTLLCHVCQSSTAWKASGTKLFPIISLCERCFDSSNRDNRAAKHVAEGETESLDDQYSESENDDVYIDHSDDDYEREEEEDEEDGENQVVPWSCNFPTASTSAPPFTTTLNSDQHGSFSPRDGGAAGFLLSK